MSENKKTLLDRAFTRRQFLKLSGKGLAGVALSSSMLLRAGLGTAGAGGRGDGRNHRHAGLPAGCQPRKVHGCQRCEAN